MPGLDADQQTAIGLFCGPYVATLTTALTPQVCAGQSVFGSKLLNLAAPGTNDPDHNPSRVAPRNLFDASVGHDNLFHGDRYKWSLRFTVVNLTNKTCGIQLPVHVQRHTLRYTASGDRGARFSFLASSSTWIVGFKSHAEEEP